LINEVNEQTPQSPNKKNSLKRIGSVANKKAQAAFSGMSKTYKETAFTPVALRPVDRSVIIL
jgi:hypothetical protein